MLIIEEHFRTGVLVYIWAKYFWRQVLEARQRNVLRIYRTVPAELKDVWRKEKYEQQRVLALYRSGFQFFKDTISTAITTSLVVFNGFRMLWDKSGEVLLCFGFNQYNIILHNVLFIMLLNSCTFLVNLPFAAYEVYIMEGRVGMHRVTMSGAILGHIVTQIILFPFVCLFIALFKLGGSKTFIYLLYISELQILLDICNLDVLEALPPSELRQKIEVLVSDQQYPIYDIYVVRDPIFKRHHSQVYIWGSPGQKLIVIYDSLARKHLAQPTENSEELCSIDEVVALVAHEIGHWQYGHDFIYFFTNQIYLCVHLLSLHLLMNYRPMFRAFGFNIQPYAVGFILMQYYPITEVCSCLVRVINRRLEFSADRYVKSLKKEEALTRAISKIGVQSSQFPVQDWLYSFCNNTEPSYHERMLALNSSR